MDWLGVVKILIICWLFTKLPPMSFWTSVFAVAGMLTLMDLTIHTIQGFL